MSDDSGYNDFFARMDDRKRNQVTPSDPDIRESIVREFSGKNYAERVNVLNIADAHLNQETPSTRIKQASNLLALRRALRDRHVLLCRLGK